MRLLAVRFILFGRLSYCIIVANIQKIYYYLEAGIMNGLEIFMVYVFLPLLVLLTV